MYFFVVSIMPTAVGLCVRIFFDFRGAGVTTACVCSSWRVERLVAWLCEGLKALVWCLALAACVFGAKNRIIHLLAICVFSLFFIFFEWQLARARFFVPTGVCKALFRDSASVLNAFWQARIVVACVSVFRGEIFYSCRPMIFPGFFLAAACPPSFCVPTGVRKALFVVMARVSVAFLQCN